MNEIKSYIDKKAHDIEGTKFSGPNMVRFTQTSHAMHQNVSLITSHQWTVTVGHR